MKRLFKLMSMTDFVLWLTENDSDDLTSGDRTNMLNNLFIKRIISYAYFLKQKLELWMFVPCKFVEGAWVVLKKPDADNYKMVTEYELKEYQEAKDRVLFEGGFDFKNERNFYYWRMDNELGSVETMIGLEFTLTPTAQKQIGL